jgi:hypothetical protein
MKINEKTISRLGRKVVPVLLWITIPMLFLADILLIQKLMPKWASTGIIDKIFAIFVLSFVFVFACFLLAILIKHKQLFLKENKIILESKFRIFGIVIFSCLIVFPAIEIIFYKKWSNLGLLIVGAGFLLMDILRWHKEKKKIFKSQ